MGAAGTIEKRDGQRLSVQFRLKVSRMFLVDFVVMLAVIAITACDYC